MQTPPWVFLLPTGERVRAGQDVPPVGERALHQRAGDRYGGPLPSWGRVRARARRGEACAGSRQGGSYFRVKARVLTSDPQQLWTTVWTEGSRGPASGGTRVRLSRGTGQPGVSGKAGPGHVGQPGSSAGVSPGPGVQLAGQAVPSCACQRLVHLLQVRGGGPGPPQEGPPVPRGRTPTG